MIPKVGLKEMSKLNFLNRASALLRGLWKGWGDRWQRKNICKPHTTRDISSMYTDAQDPIEKKKIQLESEQGTRRDISPEDSKWAHERIFHAISHREMQITAMMRYHCTPTGKAEMKTSDNSESWWGCRNHRSLTHSRWRYGMVQVLLENSFPVLLKYR